MFFAASKAVWFFLVPSTALALLALAGIGLAAAARTRPVGLALAAACLGLVLAGGIGPVGAWLLLPLENRFPAFVEDGRPVDGAIVLGGSVEPDTTMTRGQLSFGQSGERMVAMADLARRHPEARIVFSGGSGDLLVDEASEADAVERYGSALGIDTGRITFERTSRTTAENARNTRALIEIRPGTRWLLVTSALHMPRAVGSFRAAGLAVTAYPVDYRTAGPSDRTRLLPTVTIGFQRVDDAVKEWLGLLAYRLSGRTDALFPSPSSFGSAPPVRMR